MHRLSKLRQWLKGEGLDGLLVTHLPNVRYLCGFTGSAGVLLVLRSKGYLLTDTRYTTQARQEARDVAVRIARGDLLATALNLGRRKGLVLGYEAWHLMAGALERARHAGGRRVRLRPTERAVEQFRAVKDQQEIEALRASAALGSAIFAEILPLVRPGVTELDLAAEIDYRMRKRGASGPAFETIVACGERAALPHARPTARRLKKNELVLFDWGAILRGYCSDLTRTVFLGRASGRIRNWHKAVLAAQQAALGTARAGVAAGQLDRAARRVLRRAGLERYLKHSTGHGLGLEIHEEPRLAREQSALLQVGNVVTLEPGVYVNGVGGIRIEDVALIGPAGAEVLTTARRDLFEI